MCGIAGILGQGEHAPAVARMVQQMRHRGPDDEGVHSVALGPRTLALGSTRLAILDLSAAGHMPMEDPLRSNWIVYNGEVYNYTELRRELEAEGERFSSHTDTEVILKAYARWGTDCVRRFRGMFALAIWDQAQRRLFLARDRAGKKPLYYYQGPGGAFAFASELRALLAGGLVERRLAPESLETYLCNGFPIAPLTMVKGVLSLLPAHWMLVGEDGRIVQTRRYWRPPAASDQARPTADLVQEAREQLEQAVRMRLVSDVPLGAFLSGGLDSSTIVALMARHAGDVRTFSITFAEEAYDESDYALWVARRFATRHTAIRLGREDFQAWLPAALAAMDQPTFDGVNTYCVARAAREGGLTVALSGIGGDELFGGYPTFQVVPRVSRLAQTVGRLPRIVGRALAGAPAHYPYQLVGAPKAFEFLGYGSVAHSPAHDLLAGYQTTSMIFPYWMRERLLAAEARPTAAAWFGLPGQFLRFLEEEDGCTDTLGILSRQTWRLFLGERCLRDSDTMSMGVSLELRAPLTDHCFAESVWRIPDAIRCQGAPDKPFQWDLVQPYLGADYPYRKKQGFELPFETWLRDAGLLDTVQETLCADELAARVGLQPQSLQALVQAYQRQRRGIPWSAIWSLYVLLSWCARHEMAL